MDKWNSIKITDRERELLSDLKVYPDGDTVKNPFSGEEAILSAQAISLYDFIIGPNADRVRGTCKTAIKCDACDIEDIFDAAKDVFVRNWPEHYMTLLD